jgi:hypothetical protein
MAGCVPNALADTDHDTHLQPGGRLREGLGLWSGYDHTVHPHFDEDFLDGRVVPQCSSLAVIQPCRVAGKKGLPKTNELSTRTCRIFK